MRIDLHMHSTASDGAKTPAELVRYCFETCGVGTMALTDHDTVAGVAEKEAASCFNYVLTFSSLAASTADSIKNAPYYLKLMAEPLIDAFYSGFHY